jgi:hypothetical protein
MKTRCDGNVKAGFPFRRKMIEPPPRLPELEQLRVSLIGKPSWEIHCGGKVWYISARTFPEVFATWKAKAKIPPGIDLSTFKARIAYT